MKTRKEGRIIRQYLNNLTRIIIPSSVSFNYPHHLCPLPRRQMLCQLPLIVFKRYDSCRVRQWERGLLRSWGKDRAKSSGLSRDPVFFTVASLIRARACVCVCGRTCIVHGGRAALDKSPFDVCLSDFEWNGNRARRKQGGWRNRKYHFSWYRTLRILSCLAFATNFERKGLKCRRDLEWNEKKEKEKCTPF